MLGLAFLLVLFACKADNKAEVEESVGFLSADGPFGAFPEPITLSSWGGQETDKVFPPGQDWEDNIWTRGVSNDLGINFEWEWWAPANEFVQKLNTSLAGGEMPEFLSRIPYDLYVRFAEAGKLAPLDEALEEYGSEDLKGLMHLYNDEHYKKLTVNGKLYGIAPPENNNPVMVGYVRKDWLDAAGIAIPQGDYLTFREDEFYNLVDQSVEQGLGTFALSGDLFGAGFNTVPLFAMGNAFPTIWVEENDSLVHGSLTDEAKAVLQKLRDLNANGAFAKGLFCGQPLGYR